MNTECAHGDHDPEPADDLLPGLACRRCGRVLTIGPPAGHPESMTNELGADDEAYLANLDAA